MKVTAEPGQENRKDGAQVGITQVGHRRPPVRC
jgi:hypothetical protein